MTMTIKMTPLFLAALLTSAVNAARAGESSAPAIDRTVQITVAPGADMSMAGLGPRLAVKNLPYVLDIVKEHQRILGDGNQISQRSIARGYRDSAGRTREESLDDSGEVRFIVIKDPEAGIHWMLNPRSKTATKMTMPGRFAMMLRPDRDAGAGAGAGAGARNTSMLAHLNSSLSDAFGDMKWAKKATRRDLPPREIDGVKATGQLRSYEIPAGEAGNRNAIVVSDETWYAPELRITLSSKHSDPRTGDAVFRIENLKREEPAPALFVVPADYTVKEIAARGQRATIKKAE
jgi:hypothetical protein